MPLCGLTHGELPPSRLSDHSGSRRCGEGVTNLELPRQELVDDVAQQRVRIGSRLAASTRDRRREVVAGNEQAAGEQPGRQEEQRKADADGGGGKGQPSIEQARREGEEDLEEAEDGEEDRDLAGAHGRGYRSRAALARARAAAQSFEDLVAVSVLGSDFGSDFGSDLGSVFFAGSRSSRRRRRDEDSDEPPDFAADSPLRAP